MDRLIFEESDEPINEFVLKFKTILGLCKRDMRVELDFEIYKIIRNKILHDTLYQTVRNRKIWVPIVQSRYMIGIIDESGTLEEDEVHVAYTDLHGIFILLQCITVYSLINNIIVRSNYFKNVFILILVK